MIGCSEAILQSIKSHGKYAWNQKFGAWEVMTMVCLCNLFYEKYYDVFLVSHLATLPWMWYIDWHKSINSLILPGYMPARFSILSCVSCGFFSCHNQQSIYLYITKS